MKSHATKSCALAISLAVAGCASGGMSDNQVTGAAVGCAAGGALGVLLGGRDQVANAAIGCVAGGAAGYTVATLLDQREQQALAEARMRAAASNERVEWSSTPDNSPEEAPLSNANASQADTTVAANTASSESNNQSAASKPATAHKKSPAKKPTPPTKTMQANSSSAGSAKAAPATASGWIIPVKTYVAANGQTCRDMQEHAEKNGQNVDENVTMCKSASGWVLPQSA